MATKTLPSRVLNYRAQLDASSELRRDIATLKIAVFQLRAIEDLPTDIVSSLDGFTPEWLEGIIKPAIASVKSDKGLTAVKRSGALSDWYDIQRNARKQIDIIQSVVGKWGLTWCYDPSSGEVTVSDEQLERICEERATLEVPTLAATHWAKLQTIIAGIKDLREWEKAQGVEAMRIEKACEMNPIQFAECWAIGANKIDHRFDHYRANVIKTKLIV